MKLESTVAASLDAIRAELARTTLSASTMNFVVWIDDEKRREWILERAEMLGEKHPSFTLIFDKSGGCVGEARVMTSHRDAVSHFTIQGERVTIDVGCASAHDIEEYITALCPTTVPTVIWWTGAQLAGDAAFEALLRYVKAVVVDSSGAARDDTSVRALSYFAREHAGLTLRDLAWMRLRPWQDMIAQFFDDPKLLAELYSIRGLHITSGSDAEALYLGGWLASRLGWTASGPGTFTDWEGKEISFSHDREGEIRRVQSVCLDSETSWYHGEVTDDPQAVRVWVEGQYARQPRLFPLQAIDNASLIERAILERGKDDVFETALSSVGTLLG